MTMTDPIADMLTRVRNANRVYKNTVNVPASQLKAGIAEILKLEGFIKDYKIEKDDGQGSLKIFLKYAPNRVRAINGLRRISKPGLRVYARKDQIPRVLGGLGIAVVSTSQGVMSDKQSRKSGIGGEVLCYVW
jgi:small subunit ribosomal protein S8